MTGRAVTTHPAQYITFLEVVTVAAAAAVLSTDMKGISSWTDETT
jgi:hypothetical protein